MPKRRPLAAPDTAWDNRFLEASSQPGHWVTLETYTQAQDGYDMKSKLTAARRPMRTTRPELYELRLLHDPDGTHHLQARFHMAVDTPTVAPYHGEVLSAASHVHYVPSQAITVGAMEVERFRALSGTWKDRELVLIELWPSEHQLIIPLEVLDFFRLVLQDIHNPNRVDEE